MKKQNRNKDLTLIILVILILLTLFLLKNKKLAILTYPEQEALSIESELQNLPEEKPKDESLKIPIFIYHSVRPQPSKHWNGYEVTPELFEKELKYLKDNGYRTITLDELRDDLLAGEIGNTKPVVLTFDDGWQNQYKYAFPLLKKYNMIATFYIYTNPIGKKHFLNWDEIKEMNNFGMTIADHTLSHPYLKKISLEEVKRQVTESKKIIEEHLGKPVLHFASPFGYTDPKIIKIIEETGYTTARTTYKGTYHSKDDLFRLTGILATDNFDDFLKELEK